MCWEDVKIGDKSFGSERTLSIGGTAINVASPDETRTQIAFFHTSGNDIVITTNGAASPTNGFNLNNALNPIVLNVRDYGNIVKKGFSAIEITGGGTGVIAIMETSIPRPNKDE